MCVSVCVVYVCVRYMCVCVCALGGGNIYTYMCVSVCVVYVCVRNMCVCVCALGGGNIYIYIYLCMCVCGICVYVCVRWGRVIFLNVFLGEQQTISDGYGVATVSRID